MPIISALFPIRTTLPPASISTETLFSVAMFLENGRQRDPSPEARLAAAGLASARLRSRPRRSPLPSPATPPRPLPGVRLPRPEQIVPGRRWWTPPPRAKTLGKGARFSSRGRTRARARRICSEASGNPRSSQDTPADAEQREDRDAAFGMCRRSRGKRWALTARTALGGGSPASLTALCPSHTR